MGDEYDTFYIVVRVRGTRSKMGKVRKRIHEIEGIDIADNAVGDDRKFTYKGYLQGPVFRACERAFELVMRG